MINALTPEQQAYLPVFRDHWRRIGVTTGPANRGAIEPRVARVREYAEEARSGQD